MSQIILYDYFRSSAAFRVRIALNLKGLEYESRPVNLLYGKQGEEDYRALNPQGLVPVLEVDGKRLTQTLAIISFLDAKFPGTPLFPSAKADRAQVLAMALVVACDIHPLNNLRVLKYLKNDLGHGQDEIDRWYAHWIREGLEPLEKLAATTAGKFMFGDSPTIADICLVPQLYNARRFKVTLDGLPTLLRAEENAYRLDAFGGANPDCFDAPE